MTGGALPRNRIYDFGVFELFRVNMYSLPRAYEIVLIVMPDVRKGCCDGIAGMFANVCSREMLDFVRVRVGRVFGTKIASLKFRRWIKFRFRESVGASRRLKRRTAYRKLIVSRCSRRGGGDITANILVCWRNRAH